MASLVRVMGAALVLAAAAVWAAQPAAPPGDQYGPPRDDGSLGGGGGRRRRSYYAWSGRPLAADLPSIAVWKPPTYALSRPYYVPVYGVRGRLPLYFPPQHLGYAPPHAPFAGPPYLPPRPATDTPATTMALDNRFKGDDERTTKPPTTDAEGYPVWDEVARPAAMPTRRPPAARRTLPPLVHKDTTGELPGRPQAARPKEGGDNADVIASIFGQPPPPPSTTTFRPAAAAPPAGPTSCVWAIISCCSISGEIRYDCFEQRGCRGAFWDNNPCNSEYAKAAIETAMKFYN